MYDKFANAPKIPPPATHLRPLYTPQHGVARGARGAPETFCRYHCLVMSRTMMDDLGTPNVNRMDEYLEEEATASALLLDPEVTAQLHVKNEPRPTTTIPEPLTDKEGKKLLRQSPLSAPGSAYTTPTSTTCTRQS